MQLKQMLRSCAALMAVFVMLIANTSTVCADNYKYDSNNTSYKLSSIVESSGYDVALTDKYVYTKFSNSEKQLYTRLVNGIKNLDNKIEYPAKMSIESITKVYHTVFLNEPELFWISDSFDYDKKYVYPSYKTTDKSEIKTVQTAVNKQVKKLLKNAAKQKDDYSKIKYFHDWIIKNNFYCSESAYDYTVHFSLYEAFAGNFSLTEEKYAQTMQYLCDLSGIECVTICSTYNADWKKGDPAYLNVVKCNGNWYNIHVAADDDMGNERADNDYVSYAYMLVPDAWIFNSKNSTLGKKNTIKLTSKKSTVLFEPPSCTKTDDNYFTRTKNTFKTKDKAKAAIQKQLESSLKNKSKRGYVQLRCSTSEVYNYICDLETFNEAYQAASEKYTNREISYGYYCTEIGGIVIYFYEIKY